jgi:hypothetical protein
MGVGYMLGFYAGDRLIIKKEVGYNEYIKMQQFKTKSHISVDEANKGFGLTLVEQQITAESRLKLHLTSTYNGMKTTCEADILVTCD